jgi:hypothetical protein
MPYISDPDTSFGSILSFTAAFKNSKVTSTRKMGLLSNHSKNLISRCDASEFSHRINNRSNPIAGDNRITCN